MLVLSFKIGEGAYIGRDTRIIFVSRQGNEVKLGFECDQGTIVSRGTFGLERHLVRQTARESEIAAGTRGVKP